MSSSLSFLSSSSSSEDHGSDKEVDSPKKDVKKKASFQDFLLASVEGVGRRRVSRASGSKKLTKNGKNVKKEVKKERCMYFSSSSSSESSPDKSKRKRKSDKDDIDDDETEFEDILDDEDFEVPSSSKVRHKMSKVAKSSTSSKKRNVKASLKKEPETESEEELLDLDDIPSYDPKEQKNDDDDVKDDGASSSPERTEVLSQGNSPFNAEEPDLQDLLEPPPAMTSNEPGPDPGDVNFEDLLADPNGYVPPLGAAGPSGGSNFSANFAGGDFMNGFQFRTPNNTSEPKRTRRSANNPINVLKLDEEQLEVSFHKINVNKFPPGFTEDLIINFIIEKYNDPTKLHKKYEEERVLIPPHIDDEYDLQIFEGDMFQTRIFVQAAQEPVSFLSAYGIKRYKQLIHQVIFHYREGEIFAVTTGAGFHVVQWISDFDFPGKFAARLLSEKGLLESTKKGIVGTESVHRRTHKSEQEANPFDLLEFCTTYTAEFRNKASILQLSCFQNKRARTLQQQQQSSPNGGQSADPFQASDGTPSTSSKLDRFYNVLKRVKVVVSLSSIRIRKPLHPCDLPSILSIMSKISKGETSLDLDGKLEEDSTAHLKYVSIVHSEVGAELDVLLSRMIRAAIADDEKVKDLEDFALSHRLYTNFTNGFDFLLQYKKADVRNWSTSPPTWADIVRALRDYPRVSLIDCPEETFLTLLADFKLSYEVKKSLFINRRPEKMFNYLEGFLYRKEDSRLYWHVHSNWCYVKEVYLVLVHSEFAGVMKSSLKSVLREDPEANEQLGYMFRNLHLKSEEVEGLVHRYKMLHTDMQDFFIPTLPSHDLFDMIKINEEDGIKFFTVYFIVPSLDHRALSKGIQITNSLLQIKKAVLSTSGRKHDVGGSERIWTKVKAIHKLILTRPMFKDACKDIKTFLDMLASAEFRLVIGRSAIRSSGEVRSLEEECTIPTKMTSADVRKKLEDLSAISDYMLVRVKQLGNLLEAPLVGTNYAPLALALHGALMKQGYIDKSSSVTGKLLGQDKKLFDFTVPGMNSTTREFIYDEFIGPLRPQCISFLARLAIIRVHRELQSFGCKTFSVVELINKL